MIGNSHIVSIGSRTGEFLSTAEIALTEGHGGQLVPIPIQHWSAGNREPNQECNAALNAALKMLHGNATQAGLRDLADFHAKRSDKIEMLLPIRDDGYSVTMMSEVMKQVLRD